MDTPLSEQSIVQIHRKFEPRIYVPKAFPQKDKEGKAKDPMHVFLAYEVRYLDAIHRGLTHEKAVQGAGISGERALRLLKRKAAKEYLSDLMRQKMATEGLTQDWFLSELKKLWYGEREATREQMEAIKEIGSRVAPRPEKSGNGSNNPIIQINIGRIESALKRQEIIETKDLNGNIATGSAGSIPGSV